MKKYIFIDAYVGGIGGGQFYVNKKIEFLQRDEWDVLLVTGSTSSIILPNLRKTKLLTIPEVRFHLREVSRKKRDEILSIICKEISDFTDAIIESNAMHSAEWGELLAEKLHCKHIIYSLSEVNTIYSKYYYDFYNFKLQRKEIAGITQDSLKNLFSNYKTISDEESYFLSAYGAEGTVEYNVPIIESIERKDINIGIVARIDKPFVNTAIDEILEFSKRHNNSKINLLILGYQPGKEIPKSIGHKLRDVPNIILYALEMMTPIPKSFYRKVDVVISSAGCARISSLENVPTIAIDANDYKPIGIVGYTTQKYVYRDKVAEYSTKELLEKILFQGFCKDKEFSCNEFLFNSEERYRKQMDFIKNSVQKKEYFDLSHPHRRIFDLKWLVKRYLSIWLIQKIKSSLLWKF